MINLEKIIESKSPGYFKKRPKIITKLTIKILERILHTTEINQILETNADKKGLEFIDEVFDYLDFGFFLSSRDRLKIPAEGKLICVANHPVGALDGLAILKALTGVRQDVKIVVNDILMNMWQVPSTWGKPSITEALGRPPRWLSARRSTGLALDEQALDVWRHQRQKLSTAQGASRSAG